MSLEVLERRQLLSTDLVAKVTHTGVLQVNGTPGVDALVISIVNGKLQNGNSVRRSVNLDVFGIDFGTAVKRVRIDLSGGNDRLDITTDVPVHISAGTGNDLVNIDAMRSIVLGGAGNDTITSQRKLGMPSQAISLSLNDLDSRSTEYDLFVSSSNTIYGGKGDDVLQSQGGDDTIVGGSGNDKFTAYTYDVGVFTTSPIPVGRLQQTNLIQSSVCAVQEVEQFNSLDSDRPVRTVIYPNKWKHLFAVQPSGYDPIRIVTIDPIPRHA